MIPNTFRMAFVRVFRFQRARPMDGEGNATGISYFLVHIQLPEDLGRVQQVLVLIDPKFGNGQ